LVLAGLAAWAVWNFLQSVEQEAQAGQQQVNVFRAGDQNIQEGTQGDILISDFNAGGTLIAAGTDEIEDVPADAIQTDAELREVLAGKVAAGPISGNAVLTRSQWIAVTADVIPLAERIPSGKQALTIGTNNLQGVNGFVESGDRVNLIITIDLRFDLLPEQFSGIAVAPEDETAEPGTETLTVPYTRFVMQGIPVLATGRDIRAEEDAPSEGSVDATTDTVPGEEPAEDLGNETVFTLEVTPDQAERIVFAVQNGAIWMTLVPEDFVEVETPGVIIDTLFGSNILEDIFGN
ncbi:MAG TPA: RcpC/CpaB family pilus assembly protein, partial [Acidimicrobiia bacterium]|nr:RcpC/CpaB family pilus assembly protein [Acidimicrobiia bacterium]